MTCKYCNHELQWGGVAWCVHEERDCIANLRADLAAARIREEREADLVTATESKMFSLKLELVAERGRSWCWCSYATRLYDIGMVFITDIMPMYAERIDKEKFALREERARSWEGWEAAAMWREDYEQLFRDWYESRELGESE